MHPQIPLPFTLRDDYTFENFIGGGNKLLISTLQQGDEAFVFLFGEQGVGKTHLLQATCQRAATAGKTASYLPLKELHSMPAQILMGMESLDLVCIDDIQAITGNVEWEEALFNLFNQLKQQGGQLIIAAQTSPHLLAIKLKDLKSRLNSGLSLAIQALDDDATVLALTRRAKKQGFDLSPEVAHYLLTRFPRDLPSLWALLNELDQATLSAQRKLTIPFLKEFITNR